MKGIPSQVKEREKLYLEMTLKGCRWHGKIVSGNIGYQEHFCIEEDDAPPQLSWNVYKYAEREKAEIHSLDNIESVQKGLCRILESMHITKNEIEPLQKNIFQKINIKTEK
jgi:hypothetical protein